MNAAHAIDEHDQGSRGHGLDRSLVNQQLETWGRWTEENADFQGYSSMSAFMTWQSGGRVQIGHKILCRDPPPWVTCTHIRVCALHEELQFVLALLYIVRMKEDRSLWTLDEKLRKVGMSHATFRERIRQARSILLGLT